jgi:stage V sporulation protein B
MSVMHKLLKGSIIIFIGTVIFRIGGYIYLRLTHSLLDINGYGMLNLIMPFQWILILIAVGGLPPAVAKYVSEYLAKNNKFMVKQVIFTSFEIMVFLSILITIIFYFMAKPITNFLGVEPNFVTLLQIVGFIAPLSVVLGLLRGVFQGYQRMTDIMVSKAVEQIFMIGLSVIFILAGFYVFGAVIGTLIAFGLASLAALIIFKLYIWDDLKDTKKLENNVDEYKLAKNLLIFSLPIIITGLAELTLFQTGTYILKIFMDTASVGYYNVASPIARLPLTISSSVAVTLLPAASEALALNNDNIVKYVIYSYRYLLITLLPICAVVIILGRPVMDLLFPSSDGSLTYAFAGIPMSILVVGMAFFSIYGISASILQAAGKPYPAMYSLIIGTTTNLILTILLVPRYGLNGAAIATMIGSFIVMILTTMTTIRVTNTKLPYLNFLKIGLSSLLLGICLLFVPRTIPGLLTSLLLLPLVYILFLSFTRSLETYDLIILNRIIDRTGLFSKPLKKFIRYLESSL